MSEEPERIRVGDRVTIYRRGKKEIWVADFWRDGAHHRQSLRTSNKKVALDRAMKLASDLAHGNYQSPLPTLKLQDVVDSYIGYIEAENRARKTVVKYRGVLTSFVEFSVKVGVGRLNQVTPSHFDRFRAERRVDHHVKSLYCEAVIIKQLMKWAKSRRLIVENLLADIKLSKPPSEPKAGPSLDQVNQILAALVDRIRPMIAMLALTGMRAGELQRLRTEDIDFDANWVHVRSRPGAETKTRESRKIPVHPRLRLILAGLPRSKQPWVFTSGPSTKYPAGDHMINIKRLNEQFQRVVTRLSLPTGREAGFTLHSLRHFFETFAVNSGIPQRVIDTWLGHRSDKSMASVYYALSNEDSQVFMSKVPFGTGLPAAEAGPETAA
jgi:integrase